LYWVRFPDPLIDPFPNAVFLAIIFTGLGYFSEAKRYQASNKKAASCANRKAALVFNPVPLFSSDSGAPFFTGGI
jgi:hypothetical protein